jgi:hypothetical protein
MLSYKMHPSINAIWNFFDQQTTIGKPLGRERDERYRRLIGGVFLPIPFQDGLIGENTLIGDGSNKLTDKQKEILGPLIERPNPRTIRDRGEAMLIGMTGAGVINYKNAIRHHTVDMYLRQVPVFNSAGEQIRTGWEHGINNTLVEKAFFNYQDKVLKDNLTKGESFRDKQEAFMREFVKTYPLKGANMLGIKDGMKTDAQNLLGIWILEQINAGNPPTSKQMLAERNAILAAVGAVYAEEFKP